MSRFIPVGETPKRWKDRWRARLTVGYDGMGKQIQIAVYGLTKGECQARLDALRAQLMEGADLLSEKPSTAEYLQHWLDQKRLSVTHNTIRDYERTADKLKALIGRVRLDRLTALQVQNAVTTIHKSSARDASQALGLMRNALGDAERLGIVMRNVARLVRAVPYTPKKPTIWTADEVVTFITLAKPAHFYPLFRFALTLGLRAGELIALDWKDIQGGTVRIERSAKAGPKGMEVGAPKTPYSYRTLHMPADAIEMLEAQREKLGKPKDGFVFPSQRGTMADHSNISRDLKFWAERVKVNKEIRTHDLRHTYASMRISQGADAVTLSRELGHHSPAFTLSRYAHFFERSQARQPMSLMQLTGTQKPAERVESEAGKVKAKVKPEVAVDPK